MNFFKWICIHPHNTNVQQFIRDSIVKTKYVSSQCRLKCFLFIKKSFHTERRIFIIISRPINHLGRLLFSLQIVRVFKTSSMLGFWTQTQTVNTCIWFCPRIPFLVHVKSSERVFLDDVQNCSLAWDFYC